jgi:hypothetical protein
MARVKLPEIHERHRQRILIHNAISYVTGNDLAKDTRLGGLAHSHFRDGKEIDIKHSYPSGISDQTGLRSALFLAGLGPILRDLSAENRHRVRLPVWQKRSNVASMGAV